MLVLVRPRARLRFESGARAARLLDDASAPRQASDSLLQAQRERAALGAMEDVLGTVLADLERFTHALLTVSRNARADEVSAATS